MKNIIYTITLFFLLAIAGCAPITGPNCFLVIQKDWGRGRVKYTVETTEPGDKCKKKIKIIEKLMLKEDKEDEVLLPWWMIGEDIAEQMRKTLKEEVRLIERW